METTSGVVGHKSYLPTGSNTEHDSPSLPTRGRAVVLLGYNPSLVQRLTNAGFLVLVNA